jgi:putative lipoprotein
MKVALGAAIAITSSLICLPASASDGDRWFGPDKALHFGFSVVLAAGGYAASGAWLGSRNERALVGSAFSLTLGAGKELWDLSGHGDPSWRDFTWDVIGTAAGVALAASVDALTSSKEARPSASTQGLVIHF